MQGLQPHPPSIQFVADLVYATYPAERANQIGVALAEFLDSLPRSQWIILAKQTYD
jgi:hypothetical protein